VEGQSLGVLLGVLVGVIFFELYAFIILTSTLVLGINYFVIITRPLHPIMVGVLLGIF